MSTITFEHADATALCGGKGPTEWASCDVCALATKYSDGTRYAHASVYVDSLKV